MNETLGQLIHRLRKEKGFTLDAVARQIGASKAFVSLVEKDRCGISLEKIGRLASFLGSDASALIALLDSRRDETTEPWLRYLVAKYQPSEYVLDICRKFIEESGFARSVEEEGGGKAFEKRWDAFYSLVKQILDNPNYKVFVDEDVQRALRLLGMEGCDSWEELQTRVLDRIRERFGVGANCANSFDWRSHVERVLGIETVRLGSRDMNRLMTRALTSGAAQDVLAGMTMVAASPTIYGAVYKYNDVGSDLWRYCFVEDCVGEKAALKSETFWYEAARVFMDADLTLGHGCVYVPDGAPFDPMHFFLTRIASWMALSFDGARKVIRGVHSDEPITPQMIMGMRDDVASDLPIRFAMTGMLDLINRPLFYLDCYKRLKASQLKDKKISVSDVATMRDDPDACLRVGYSFRNVFASQSSTDIRFNLQIPDTSVVRRAFDQCGYVSGSEHLESSWDPRYHLKGDVQIEAVYSERCRNVRAVVELL